MLIVLLKAITITLFSYLAYKDFKYSLLPAREMYLFLYSSVLLISAGINNYWVLLFVIPILILQILEIKKNENFEISKGIDFTYLDERTREWINQYRKHSLLGTVPTEVIYNGKEIINERERVGEERQIKSEKKLGTLLKNLCNIGLSDIFLLIFFLSLVYISYFKFGDGILVFISALLILNILIMSLIFYLKRKKSSNLIELTIKANPLKIGNEYNLLVSRMEFVKNFKNLDTKAEEKEINKDSDEETKIISPEEVLRIVKSKKIEHFKYLEKTYPAFPCLLVIIPLVIFL